MVQLDVNQNILFRDFETQLLILATEQNELSEIQEKCFTQSAQKRKSKGTQKPERSRSKYHGGNVEVSPWDIRIEPCGRSNPSASAFPLQAPHTTHIRAEGDHVEAWWNEVDGAAEYELWVCPHAFDIPEPPADCLYRGIDHALIFPIKHINQPGFYHFRSRAVDVAGRPGGWSSEQVLVFHVPVLEPDVIPGSQFGELSIHWEPVENARYYEIQMDQWMVYSSVEPFKCLENLPLGQHDFKIRPVFSGGATEWDDLPVLQTRLDLPLEITPQEVSIFANRNAYFLHWFCPADAPVESFSIIDPDHDQCVLGQLIFQETERSWLGSFIKSLHAYRWPIPPALQIEGQRFAVQAVKGKVTGPLSEIKTFPYSGKSHQTKIPKNEVECNVGDVDPTLREFLRKKQVHEKLTEQKLEMYDGPNNLRQYSVYHCPVLQAMNLQPRTDYRLSLTLNNGQLWQVEIIFNPTTYKYNLTFQGKSGL